MEAITIGKAMQKFNNSHRVGETRFKESDRSHPKLHSVDYRYFRVDIILQIGWETNTSHVECQKLSIEQ